MSNIDPNSLDYTFVRPKDPAGYYTIGRGDNCRFIVMDRPSWLRRKLMGILLDLHWVDME
jgi:hypothetical protein